MKNKIRFSILLLSALPICVNTVYSAPTESNDMTQALEDIRKKNDLPALALVVVKDGRICDRAAVGVRKQGDPTPVTTNDVFHIGSCTKSMTATLTAMMIEQGKLRWSTTIAEVFPELKGKMDKRYENVTVEQLLTHRGGVPGEPPSAAWKRAWDEVGTPVQQRREFIEAVLVKPPEAAPGTKMIYSNQGYAIVGAMLEKIMGQPWETLIAERKEQLTSLGDTRGHWVSSGPRRRTIRPPSLLLAGSIVHLTTWPALSCCTSSAANRAAS